MTNHQRVPTACPCAREASEHAPPRLALPCTAIVSSPRPWAHASMPVPTVATCSRLAIVASAPLELHARSPGHALR